jgi:PAS domain S-box-containing protein
MAGNEDRPDRLEDHDQSDIQARDGLVQTVLDSLTHPFYVIDVATRRIRLANRAARAIHTAASATCHVLAHASDVPCSDPDHPCPLRIITETRQPTVVEHVHRDARGRCRNVEVHGFPIFDKAGEVVQIIEYCVDVTEHRRIVEQHAWELAVNKAIVELADALIGSSFSIAEIADTVLHQAQQLTGSEHGFVSSIDADTGACTSHTLTHMMPNQCRIEGEQASIVFYPDDDRRYPGLWGHALNTSQGFYSNAPATHPASTGIPQGHVPLRNFLTVPALVDDTAVGQIALANNEQGYCDRHLEAIGRIAKLYALAVQRWRVDMALKGSEERYALAQKAANIGSWDWDIVTSRLVWSDRIEPMFGFVRGQFQGTYEAFLGCVHPDDRQFVVDAVNACVENERDYRIEHRIIWPDGTVRWVAETGDVVRDPAGKAIRMLGVVQDITERKHAEIQARDLAKFASENPSPIVRIRGDGIVLYSNRPGLALMKKWNTQPGRPMPPEWRRRIAAVRESGMTRLMEAEGEGRVFSLVLVPVAGADYVNIYGSDVTDHRKAERQIRELNQQLEKRVLERTRELTEANRQLRDEFERRRRLEREVLEISEREQRRIGRELHDSLGQQLTGIAIMSKVLEQNLQRQSVTEAVDAKEIAQLINQAVEETRQLARGLHPIGLDESGLAAALEALVVTTQKLFGISCRLRCQTLVPVRDATTAVHLYRIAQEAITNAIRHGAPQNILVELRDRQGRATLTITNDGRHFPTQLPQHGGMGLQVMSHRAEMIDGVLDVRPIPTGGTRVTCTFNRERRNNEGETEHDRYDTGQRTPASEARGAHRR